MDGEDKAVDEFFEKKIGGINKALQEQTLKIVEEFEKRKGELRSLHAVCCKERMPSCEAKEQKTAEDCSYNRLKDPYALQTARSGQPYSVLSLLSQRLLHLLQQGRVLVSDGVFVHKFLKNGGISSKSIHIKSFFLNTFLRRKNGSN